MYTRGGRSGVEDDGVGIIVGGRDWVLASSRLTTERTSSIENGFFRKSATPDRNAAMTASMSPKPVKMITGTPGICSKIFFARSMPFMPVILRSVMTRSNRSVSVICKARSALGAVRTAYPDAFNISPRALQTCTESSTTRILLASSDMVAT